MGIGVCQVAIARREPALVRVLNKDFSYVLGLWVVMHEALRTSPRMRLVHEHLATELEAFTATSRP